MTSNPKPNLSSELVADYVIGDVQGCYDALQRLLEQIFFDVNNDCLWFVGDLVNRGPQSLEVLRFIKNLKTPAKITLGNHDLHLLSLIDAPESQRPYDQTLDPILKAEDAKEISAWLRQQSLLHYDIDLNVVMTHAGIPPCWTLEEAIGYAKELEHVLKSPAYPTFLKEMYGNMPNLWSTHLTGMPRLRLICNYFTRMRFCYADGRLDLHYTGELASAPAELYPWYALPERKPIPVDIVFGHWAALEGKCPASNIFALDTGCVWGNALTALRLQDRQRFTVGCERVS